MKRGTKNEYSLIKKKTYRVYFLTKKYRAMNDFTGTL